MFIGNRPFNNKTYSVPYLRIVTQRFTFTLTDAESRLLFGFCLQVRKIIDFKTIHTIQTNIWVYLMLLGKASYPRINCTTLLHIVKICMAQLFQGVVHTNNLIPSYFFVSFSPNHCLSSKEAMLYFPFWIWFLFYLIVPRVYWR